VDKIKLYCSECEKWVTCKVPRNPRSDQFTFAIRRKQQGRSTVYPDIWWFERLHLCPEEHEVNTRQIDSRIVNELIELRKLVERFPPAALSALAKKSKCLMKQRKRLELVKRSASV
jgi:hypothetical protein